MRHFVVALDENGTPIKHMDVATSTGEVEDFTGDWSEATAYCGMLNHYHQEGDTLDGKKVGGYEVVSEGEDDEGRESEADEGPPCHR